MSTAAARNLDLASAVQEAERDYVAANPKSRTQHALACRSMAGGNLRSHLHFAPFPLTLSKGEGAYVWDIDGHRYADFLGEYSAGLFGHNDPVISAALKAAIDRGMVMGGPGELEVFLAAALCERFPSIDLVRFANSGTEANLFALAAARLFAGRDTILVFSGAYHGSCFRFAKGGTALNVPFPYVFARYNDTEDALRVIREYAAKLAAIIIEPILGSGGYIAAEHEFLMALRRESEQHGIVLIFDEVQTSRMAPGGMQSLLGVIPDMTTLGKYMGGGCSFGAFGGRADIMRVFDPREPDAVFHAGTFNNNRLSMSAGYAALSVLQPEAIANLRKRGDSLRARLQAAASQRNLPIYVTGFGSLMNIHFTGRPVRSYEDVPADTERQKRLWHFDMLSYGQYCPPRGGVLLSMPMHDREIDRFVTSFEDFLDNRQHVLLEAAAAGAR